MARMAITYEEFVARAIQRYGEAEAQRICPGYGRLFAREARGLASEASVEDAASLRRVADMMDPDLRQEAT